MKKTHYRSVYKSNHLGVADLEEMLGDGKKLIFTIKEVKREDTVVAGKKGTFNIAYFHENIKPLVLNSTNVKIVKSFAESIHLEDWLDILIELYIDPTVKMSGVVTGGVRVRPTQPKLTKPQLTASHPRYAGVLKSCKEKTTTIDILKSVFDLPADIEKKLKDLLNA